MAVVTLDNVWKKFTLHHQRTRSIKQAAVDLISPFRPKQDIDAFWALQGVSFNLEQGETVGIIGSNGSGKSTILKLVVGISKPTKGHIHVNGRVSALLELGAGFHPDFTGRENIFLNGAILGLSRRQIEKRFDDIVEFAELERFIDNPVRTYSSGMYMRLAFAIAINVDPDILAVDEVLAVGDSAFHAKCYDQINRFKREGKSILFVSHDLSSVRRFCDRAVWLDHGQQRAEGPVNEIANLYDEHMSQRQKAIARVSSQFPIHFESARILSDAETINSGEPLQLEFHYVNEDSNFRPVFRMRINRQDGLCCYSSNSPASIAPPPRGEASTITLQIEQLNLMSGRYLCEVIARDAEAQNEEETSITVPFEVSCDNSGEGITPLNCLWNYSPSRKRVII